MGCDCRINDVGLIGYDECYQFQKEKVEVVIAGGCQSLIFCEHPSVITLGRLAKEENILSKSECKKRGAQIRDIDRGGDVTLHSPGQLIIYPIVDLRNYGKDLKIFLSMLEQVILDVLKVLGILAMRVDGQMGVYVEGKKIASIGIGVRKWIAFHGLSLNVNNDMSLYQLIRPCDLDVEMVSVQDILQKEVKLDEIKSCFADCFCRVFRLNYI